MEIMVEIGKHVDQIKWDHGLSRDDLCAYAWIGYVDACDSYDPQSFKVPFRQYLKGRINLAIVDGSRSENQVSRSIMAKAKRMAVDKSITVDEAVGVISPYLRPQSINDLEIGEDRFEAVDRRLLLSFGFSRLTAREISVVWMSFYRGDTLKKIGESMNITESAASLIRTEALQKMKDAMTFDEV